MRVLSLLLLFSVLADDDEKRQEAVGKFADVQASNRKSFHGYRWNQREEVFLDRERRARRSFVAELDKQGTITATLQSSALIKPRKPKLKLVYTAADKKRDKELIAWVEQAELVLRAYVYYPTAKLTAALRRAKVVQGTGSYEHAVVADATDFLNPGDTVRVWIDPKAMRPIRLEYTTRVKGESVRGRISYELLKKTQAYYPHRAELYSARRKIQLKLENHTLQAPAKK
jgi:hypothetical protein